MIEQITDGCGIEFKVVVNGKIETFKLHLISKYNKFWKTSTYSFLFINNNKTLCSDSSCYSGGATGFGKHTNEIKDLEDFLHLNDAVIITDDIDEINKIADKEAAIRQQEVEAINALPTSFSTGSPTIDKEYEFFRTEATFNHAYSRKINGGVIYLHKKNSDKFSYLNLKHFETKDHRIKVAQFQEVFGKLFNSLTNAEAKQIFIALKLRQKEIEQIINDCVVVD